MKNIYEEAMISSIYTYSLYVLIKSVYLSLILMFVFYPEW